MKKLVLGMTVATGLAVVMAGQSQAASLTSCDMNQAILEAEAAIRAVGGEYSTLSDAKGVSIREHVKYLQERVEIARRLVNGDESVRYPDELYATVTEGTRALKLITGTAKKEAQQTAAPKKATQAVAKIETGVLKKDAKLANLSVSAEVVATPEETTGLDEEMKVPATGEIDTGELEKILMTIGVASAVGMLGLAGICMVIGRK